MRLKSKKWLFLAILALVPILSGCEGCDRKPGAPPAPDPPSNLSATAVSTTQIDLAWSDNSSDEEGFYVYRKASNYTKIAILNANTTSYSNTGLSAETTYWYNVTAYNDGGESDPSNEVSVTTPAEPPPPPGPLEPPSDVKATVVSYKQINLSWRDNSDDEDGFNVRCNIGDTRTKTVATLSPNVTEYEHCKLQPMTHHKYCIEAFRGEETASPPQVSATTLPAPVEILYSWLTFVPNTRYKISGDVQSEADEACLVEITGYLYEQGGTEPVATGWDTFYLAADSWVKRFEIYIVEGGSTTGVCYPNCDYSVEITDVEIEY